MGWLQLVGSIKLYVSFAKETYKRDDILQKRPIILSILLTVATPPHIHDFMCVAKSSPSLDEQDRLFSARDPLKKVALRGPSSCLQAWHRREDCYHPQSSAQCFWATGLNFFSGSSASVPAAPRLPATLAESAAVQWFFAMQTPFPLTDCSQDACAPL